MLIAAVAAVRLSTRTGLPSLLLYLGLGIVLGEDVLGIPFDDQQLAQSIGYTALALILAEGGLTTRWESIRGSLGPRLGAGHGGHLRVVPGDRRSAPGCCSTSTC